MHKAEGSAVLRRPRPTAKECQLSVIAIPEMRLSEHAEQALATPMSVTMRQIATLGKSVGSPWGTDQKTAAQAAMIAPRR
jgi:hypothetical protein